MAGFVVLEGIDGCGKSSVARRVTKRLGRRAVLTREPTDSWMGRAVRKGDGRHLSPYTDALLFMTDRAIHTERIVDLLEKGKLVVCDRYYHSTVAYQAAYLKEALGEDAFDWLLEANLKISIKPDITVFLDIPPELGLRRISRRRTLSRFERLSFLRRVRANYVLLMHRDRSMVRIDGTKGLTEVTDRVLSLIRKRNL